MASGQGVAFCSVTEFLLEPPFLSQSLNRVKELCGDTLGGPCLQCHLAERSCPLLSDPLMSTNTWEARKRGRVAVYHTGFWVLPLVEVPWRVSIFLHRPPLRVSLDTQSETGVTSYLTLKVRWGDLIFGIVRGTLACCLAHGASL